MGSVGVRVAEIRFAGFRHCNTWLSSMRLGFKNCPRKLQTYLIVS